MKEGEPMWCAITTANFADDTVTLEMRGDYRVKAGLHVLMPESDYKAMLAAAPASQAAGAVEGDTGANMKAPLGYIRFDYINGDGREDSKVISHDEMRERYAAMRDQAARLTPPAASGLSEAAGLADDLQRALVKLSRIPNASQYVIEAQHFVQSALRRLTPPSIAGASVTEAMVEWKDLPAPVLETMREIGNFAPRADP